MLALPRPRRVATVLLPDLALPLALGAFAVCAAAIWAAGTALSNYTDTFSDRLGLGDALGGLILLAVATNLPEIAITVTAAKNGQLDVAVSNRDCPGSR
jgi:cation:H+ antiporter